MLSRLVHLLIDPLFIFTVLLSLTLIFLFRKKQGLYKGFLTATVLWFLVISTPVIPNLLIHSLESQYQPIERIDAERLQPPVDILVLGGGHSNDPRLPANSRLSQQAMMRLAEGIRIHRMIPGSRFVLSGFSSSNTRSQAENLAMAAESLGVDGSHIILQPEPADTWEEAIAYAGRAEEMRRRDQTIGTLVLVTSAAHMPRAIRMMEYHLSIHIVPSPTNYRYKMDEQGTVSFWSIFPAVGNISKMKYAMKEYAGLAEFYLLLT